MSARLRPASRTAAADEPHGVVPVGRRLVGRLAPARRVRLREGLPRRPGLDQEGRDHALRRRAGRAAERGAARWRPADDRPAEARPAESRGQTARQARRSEDDHGPRPPAQQAAGERRQIGLERRQLDEGRGRETPLAQRAAQRDERRVRVVVGGRDHGERPAGRGAGDRVGQHRGDALVGGRQREEPRHVGVVGRGVGAAGAQEEEVGLEGDLDGEVGRRAVDTPDHRPGTALVDEPREIARSRPSTGSPTRRAGGGTACPRGRRAVRELPR